MHVSKLVGFLALVLLGAAAAAAAEETAPDASRDYVVGIEDRLRVVVWGEPDLSLLVSVRPDGKITLPLVNDIHVAGLTPEQIRQQIAGRLAEYVRAPNVTVIVEEINSFRVYFLGEINDQGVVLLRQPTRLLQALASAGGLTEFSKKRITLLRQQDGTEKRVEIDYKQLATGEPGEQNIYLKPGDTVLVD
jgi:polysaccharide export outer membrane protein